MLVFAFVLAARIPCDASGDVDSTFTNDLSQIRKEIVEHVHIMPEMKYAGLNEVVRVYFICNPKGEIEQVHAVSSNPALSKSIANQVDQLKVDAGVVTEETRLWIDVRVRVL